MPFIDADGPPYTELEAALRDLPRFGLPIVLTNGPVPVALILTRMLSAKCDKQATLPDSGATQPLTPISKGMAELGDAETTKQRSVTLSGLRTPQSARL
jgi:hypothetical protein